MDSEPSPWTAWYSVWMSLNIHLHMLFVDGVYTFDDERPRLHRGCAPAQPELQRLLRAIATRVTRALERQGLLIRDDETPLPRPRTRRRIRATPRRRRPLPHRHRPPHRAQGPDPAHRRVQPAGVRPLHRSALGILPPSPPRMVQSGVGTCCRAHERASLERLCRYIARPALSNERLSVNDRGQVVYRLKHPFHDATTHVVLDPMEFMRHIRVPHPFGAASGCANRQSCRFGIARLAAPEVPLAQRARSVPRPRAHLTRYHGVFAPNFKHRRRIVPKPAHQTAREPHASRPAPMSWMQRLKHVFHIDIEHCGVCGGTLRVIACIETPDVIQRILTHLAARNTGCIDYPRAPPLRAPEAQPPASPSPTPS